MKKKICLLFSLGLTIMAAGCGDITSSTRGTTLSPSVADVLESGIEEENSGLDQSDSLEEASVQEQSEVAEDNSDLEQTGDTEGIDVDLTTMSATVVYSEVYNMMVSPSEYVGKTVKMDGMFTVYYDEALDKYYYACIIMDATACCSQGIEFVLIKDYTYPDDYPQEGENICVLGTFDTYEEDGFTYCTLRDSIICLE